MAVWCRLFGAPARRAPAGRVGAAGVRGVSLRVAAWGRAPSSLEATGDRRGGGGGGCSRCIARSRSGWGLLAPPAAPSGAMTRAVGASARPMGPLPLRPAARSVESSGPSKRNRRWAVAPPPAPLRPDARGVEGSRPPKGSRRRAVAPPSRALRPGARGLEGSGGERAAEGRTADGRGTTGRDHTESAGHGACTAPAKRPTRVAPRVGRLVDRTFGPSLRRGRGTGVEERGHQAHGRRHPRTRVRAPSPTFPMSATSTSPPASSRPWGRRGADG